MCRASSEPDGISLLTAKSGEQKYGKGYSFSYRSYSFATKNILFLHKDLSAASHEMTLFTCIQSLPAKFRTRTDELRAKRNLDP